jgi:hypothetical protein
MADWDHYRQWVYPETTNPLSLLHSHSHPQPLWPPPHHRPSSCYWRVSPQLCVSPSWSSSSASSWVQSPVTSGPPPSADCHNAFPRILGPVVRSYRAGARLLRCWIQRVCNSESAWWNRKPFWLANFLTWWGLVPRGPEVGWSVTLQIHLSRDRANTDCIDLLSLLVIKDYLIQKCLV